MRLRVHLRRLPALLGAALLLVCWFYLGWNTTVGEAFPKLRFRTKQTIAGVFAEEAPKITPETILNYTAQRYISESIGRLSPIYGPAIRGKSAFEYNVLGMSANAVVGRHRELFQAPYVVEFCSRNMKDFIPRARAWAARIRAMQDMVQARGQTFLYVLTPSKLGTYPEWLPSGYGCPSTPEDRAALLPTWRAMLDAQGVDYVDTTRFIQENRYRLGIDLFARGGIHWNHLGAAMAAQAITNHLNARLGRQVLTPFTYNFSISDRPVGTDRDMFEILNSPFADDHYPVPVMTYLATAPSVCKPAQIALVGGSFMFTVNDVLATMPCPPHVDEWWYWSFRLYSYPPAEPKPVMTVDPAARREDLLHTASIIIYEENESNLPGPGHGVALDEFLTKEASQTKQAVN